MSKKDKKEKEFVKKIGNMVMAVKNDIDKTAKDYGWSESEALYIFTTSLMRFARLEQGV